MLISGYNKDHCWQYDIRLQRKERDLYMNGLDQETVSNLRVSDFTFQSYDLSKSDRIKHSARLFIETYEWLGKMSQYPSHIFTAMYDGILCGVVVFDQPVAFSNLLGENTRKIERLISRGACISFAPKGLPSSLIMYGIRWCAKNTPYRLFTAYSDPSARELGTIYQACNFIYLGQKYGRAKKYISPATGEWVSDRSFRTRSAYKRYAKFLGIEWQPEWSLGDKVYWDRIPDDIELLLREESKRVLDDSVYEEVPIKHKYAYILGKDKRETKKYKKLYREINGDDVLSYPKVR